MSVLKFLDKKFELMLLGIMLAVFTVLMFVNVVLRYCLGDAIVWGDELCRYCLVGSTFLSIPIWIRRRSGIRVDAVISLLPKRIQKVMDVVVYLILLVFFIYLFVVGMNVMESMEGQLSAAMRMPTAWLYGVLEFGFLLSAFRTVQVLVLQVREFNKPEPAETTPEEVEN